MGKINGFLENNFKVVEGSCFLGKIFFVWFKFVLYKDDGDRGYKFVFVILKSKKFLLVFLMYLVVKFNMIWILVVEYSLKCKDYLGFLFMLVSVNFNIMVE